MKENRDINHGEPDDYNPDGLMAIDMDFDKLIEVNHSLKEQLVPQQEIVRGMRRLIQEDIHEAYENSLKRIDSETQYFGEWKEFGMDISVLLAQADFQFLDSRIPVRFVPADSNVELSGSTGGAFDPVKREIIIKRDMHGDEYNILEILATEGYMPDANVLMHEVVHSTQFSPSKFLNRVEMLYSQIMRQGNYKTELREAHAYRMAGSIPYDRIHPDRSMSHTTHFPGSEASVVTLVRYFSSFDLKRKYPNTNAEKFIYAFGVIDRLKVLGFNVSEIGTMIQKSGPWDDKNAVYPIIEQVIERKAQELGVDEYDIANLVQAAKLKKENERLKAMKIAQEEILKKSSMLDGG